MPKTTGHRDREKYLVERLAKKIPSVGTSGKGPMHLGIGDDSAVLRPSANSEWVVSCDFSLENVHFRVATHPPASIGYRCLARATSDIAAMGARPRYFLLALALPAEKTSEAKGANWLDSFSSGLARAARDLDMLLIGGDITVSPSVTISVTVIGELPAGLAIPRSGARPGDLIYATGTLGAAQLGLQLLLRGLTGNPAAAKLLEPHLYPRIPIALAQALARRRIPSAMMDISDGLSTDLARLCESSRVGARLFAPQIPGVKISSAIVDYYSHPGSTYCHSEPMRPVSSEQKGSPESVRSSSGHGFSRAVINTGTVRLQPLRDVLGPSQSSAPDPTAYSFNEPAVLDPLQLALHGGEDYALLLTVPPKRAPLLRAIAAKTKTRITHIGEITRSRKILLVDSDGRSSLLAPRGWNPFRE